MNVKRMEKLAAHLDSIPRKGFKMEWWVMNREGEWVGNSKDLRRAIQNHFTCGMAACVGGHAAIVFPRELQLINGALRGHATSGTWAVGRTLGLCDVHATQLTSPSTGHSTPKQAARFIRRLIKEAPKCCGGAR